jgi:hypothetical protein
MNARPYGNAAKVLDGLDSAVDEVLAKTMLRAGAVVGGEIARVVVRRFPGGTGALARSFLPPTFISKRPGEIKVGALSSLVYARIQDEGGSIKAKRSKLLAIPLTPKAKSRWPRDWPKNSLALIKTKKGNLLLIDAKSKRIKAHYVLTPRVRIPGRNYLAEAEANSMDEVNAILTDAFGKRIDVEIAKVPVR